MRVLELRQGAGLARQAARILARQQERERHTTTLIDRDVFDHLGGDDIRAAPRIHDGAQRVRNLQYQVLSHGGNVPCAPSRGPATTITTIAANA